MNGSLLVNVSQFEMKYPGLNLNLTSNTLQTTGLKVKIPRPRSHLSQLPTEAVSNYLAIRTVQLQGRAGRL